MYEINSFIDTFLTMSMGWVLGRVICLDSIEHGVLIVYPGPLLLNLNEGSIRYQMTVSGVSVSSVTCDQPSVLPTTNPLSY